MAALSPFFQNVFAMCTNGIIPNLKFQQALSSEHAKSPIYHTGEHAESWVPNAGACMSLEQCE